mgnify:FL=1
MKLLGKVINGDGEGKGLGFPTANLKLENSLNLEDGVYIGEVNFNKKLFKALVIKGVRNELEVWLYDFTGDLYGEVLEVVIGNKISKVEKIEDKEQLIEKIKNDINIAKSVWEIN